MYAYLIIILPANLFKSQPFLSGHRPLLVLEAFSSKLSSSLHPWAKILHHIKAKDQSISYVKDCWLCAVAALPKAIHPQPPLLPLFVPMKSTSPISQPFSLSLPLFILPSHQLQMWFSLLVWILFIHQLSFHNHAVTQSHTHFHVPASPCSSWTSPDHIMCLLKILSIAKCLNIPLYSVNINCWKGELLNLCWASIALFWQTFKKLYIFHWVLAWICWGLNFSTLPQKRSKNHNFILFGSSNIAKIK